MLFHLHPPGMLKISNERTANDDLIANLLLISFYSFFNYSNALFNDILLLATLQGLLSLIPVNDSQSEKENAVS